MIALGAAVAAPAACDAPPAQVSLCETEVSATGVAAGAEPLGSAVYEVPVGARFVSPTGNDSADGSEGAPWRTVNKAVATAASGTTIVLREGTFHEQVVTRADRRFTFQPYPNETVWFSGSRPVKGWVGDGGDWRVDGWTTRFSRAWVDPSMIDPKHPYAAYPDMAFLDGEPLRQVGLRGDVKPGTFFVDETSSKLFIGDNPAGHIVEASTIAEALHTLAPNSVIRGLGFKHFANPVSRLGAVKVSGAGSVIENNVVLANATAGISALADNVTVQRNTVLDNGQLGVHGHLANGLRLEANVIASNNTERFITWAAAGGAKVTESTDVTMKSNVVDDNVGHGLWFDLSSHRATVVDNVTRHNRSAGIFFEISDGAVIAGNVSVDNEAGIQAGEASNVEMWNNVMIDNLYALRVYKGQRVAAPHGYTIRNNVISTAVPSALPQLDNDDVTDTLTWQEMGWSSDHNAFYRRSTTTNEFFEVLSNGENGRLHYKNLAAAKDAGHERHSVGVDNIDSDPYVVDEAACRYLAPDSSPAAEHGQPLPAHIGAALDQPTGATDIGVG